MEPPSIEYINIGSQQRPIKPLKMTNNPDFQVLNIIGMEDREVRGFLKDNADIRVRVTQHIGLSSTGISTTCLCGQRRYM